MRFTAAPRILLLLAGLLLASSLVTAQELIPLKTMLARTGKTSVTTSEASVTTSEASITTSKGSAPKAPHHDHSFDGGQWLCNSIQLFGHAPRWVKPGQLFTYRLTVSMPTQKDSSGRTDIYLALPMNYNNLVRYVSVAGVSASPAKSGVSIYSSYSGIYFSGLEGAKKYTLTIKLAVSEDECGPGTLDFRAWSYNTDTFSECEAEYTLDPVPIKRTKTCAPTPVPTDSPTPSPTPSPACEIANVGTLNYGPNPYTLALTGSTLYSDCGAMYDTKAFTFLPTNTGYHIFSTCGTIMTDQNLAVSTVCGDRQAEVACNEDGCSCAPGGCDGNAYAPRAQANLTQGQTYYVYLGGWEALNSTLNNSGVLTITYAP